jgi:hypothetical protein
VFSVARFTSAREINYPLTTACVSYAPVKEWFAKRTSTRENGAPYDFNAKSSFKLLGLRNAIILSYLRTVGQSMDGNERACRVQSVNEHRCTAAMSSQLLLVLADPSLFSNIEIHFDGQQHYHYSIPGNGIPRLITTRWPQIYAHK